MFTGSGFTRLENKHCDNAKHGHYVDIKAAMNVCSSDQNCFGVYDGGCDGEGARLCNAHPKKVETYAGECIYVRTGNISKDIS